MTGSYKKDVNCELMDVQDKAPQQTNGAAQSTNLKYKHLEAHAPPQHLILLSFRGVANLNSPVHTAQILGRIDA